MRGYERKGQIKLSRCVIEVRNKGELVERSFGVIFAPEFAANNPTEIVKSCPIIREMTQLTKYDSHTKCDVKIPLYKVEFVFPEIPPSLTIGLLTWEVTPFYPAPRQCFACLSYDHLFKDCRGKNDVAICKECGKNAGLDKKKSEKQGKRIMSHHICNKTPVCPNCPIGRNNHSPSDLNCDRKRKENAIIKLRVDEKISYQEARKRITPEFKDKMQVIEKLIGKKVPPPPPPPPPSKDRKEKGTNMEGNNKYLPALPLNDMSTIDLEVYESPTQNNQPIYPVGLGTLMSDDTDTDSDESPCFKNFKRTPKEPNIYGRLKSKCVRKMATT